MQWASNLLKARIKRAPSLKRLVLVSMRIFSAFNLRIRLDTPIRYAEFFRDWRRFKRMGGKAAALDFYPCLFDKTISSNIDSHYFHQAIWAFRLIKENAPNRHVDVASDVNFVGMLTTITDVLFVDIRPLFIRIPNFQAIGASVTALPFADESVDSFSCFHVIEHIGLGRYGDPIDPLGPEKALSEISRVLAPGGNAYISVPIGRPRVGFNGLRVFSPKEIPALLPGATIQSMSVVEVSGQFLDKVNPESADISESGGVMDFGLGMYWFSKPLRGES